MRNFTYQAPTKVYFGDNQLFHLSEEIKTYGKRVLLCYGGGSIKKIGLYDKVMDELNKADIDVFELSGIEPNPRVESVRKGVQICKDKNIDLILAIGGGSTIDCSKWIAAGACVAHDVWDFFTTDVKPEKALPIISILTLAATGSEMNGGGVISNLETKDKIGRASNILRPKVSFLDPTNTYTVNEYQTACGSADILSHLIEVYFNREDDLYMLDCFIEGMMKTVIKYAPIAMKDPTNYEARANLMWTSSWAINGFINGGKKHSWSCHPMEHQLSAVYDITHGLGLAILTPRWMEYCLDDDNVFKYVQFGTNVFGIDSNLEPMEIARLSIKKLSDFFYNTLKLQSNFTELSINSDDFKEMAKKACLAKGGVIKGFKTLNESDVEKIYEMCEQ